MKKVFIVFFATVMIFTSSLLAEDQVFEKGSQLIGAELGISYFGTPIGISYEFGLKEKIGIGASFMYQSWGYDLGIFGDYNQTLLTPSVFGMYRFNDLIKIPKLDLAGGVTAGFSIYSSDWADEAATGGVFVGLIATARYFVTEKIAIHLKETFNLLGDWSGSYTLFGVTFRLK